MEKPRFLFYLVHKDGYQVLGAGRKGASGYVMFQLFHPHAQVFNDAGQRRYFQRVDDLPGDTIQEMIESGEWDVAGTSPYP